MPETQPRKMIESAWAWAKAKGRVRKNEVHGEEEIKIVLTETFDVNNADIEEVERSGSIAIQEQSNMNTLNYFFLISFYPKSFRGFYWDTHIQIVLANRDYPKLLLWNLLELFSDQSTLAKRNYILPALLLLPACRTRQALSLILTFLMLEQATASWLELGELAMWNPHPQVEWEILLPV